MWHKFEVATPQILAAFGLGPYGDCTKRNTGAFILGSLPAFHQLAAANCCKLVRRAKN
jgi:hypothetical protein